jgi:predicted nucleotidyltransferase
MVKNVILKIRAGSHLYGLNTAQSDEDYVGVYLNTPEEMLGLNSSEIIDDSVISKRENSNKNDKDAIDCTYYELRKFCKLCLNANPTMLEVLFVDDKNIVECDEYGKILLSNKNLFLSTKVKHSYIGYAFSQKKKSQVKSENLRDLYFARDEFVKIKNKSDMLYDYLDILKKSLGTKNWKYPDYIQFGDLRFNNQKVRDAIAKIDARIDKASHRADGMLEHGMDYKFISHTLRLLSEGEELLTTGDLKFPLKEKDLLLSIKLGELKPSEVMNIIDAREAKLEEIHTSNISPLPHSPNFNAVNNLVIDIYKQHLGIADNRQIGWELER